MEKYIEIIEKGTNKIFKGIKKLGKLVEEDKYSYLTKTIIKLILLIISYLILSLFTEGIVTIGNSIIYSIGTTGRTLLTSIWTVVVYFTYFLFILASLYKIALSIQADKHNLIFKSKSKDKEIKSKILDGIFHVIRICGTIILIPLFVIDIAAFFDIGLLVSYIRDGIYLYSLFVGAFGVVFFITTTIFLIKSILSTNDTNLKQFACMLMASILVISISTVGVLFETKDYKTVDSLTSDFKLDDMTFEYKMYSNKEYVITNNGSDKNINIVIDDSLGSYVQVKVEKYDTNIVNNKFKNIKDKAYISFDQELDLDRSDMEKIYNLGIESIKEKTLYNYSLLKFSRLEIKVSSDYLKNVKLKDNQGKEYTPDVKNR